MQAEHNGAIADMNRPHQWAETWNPSPLSADSVLVA
jgi:hypothetical protein